MPIQEKKMRSMLELEEGNDYLVDYYAFFGVDQDMLVIADVEAAKDLLKAAYREKNLQYHPDRYTHLSPIIKMQAEQVHRSVERGHKTLIDPKKRGVYNKQLAEWKGPISTNGFAVYDWNFQADITRKPMTDEQITETKVLLASITGYNPNTHQLLERLADVGKTDPEIRDALDHSLQSKEIFIGIEEHLHWEQAGVPGHPMGEEAPAGYLDRVRSELQELRENVPEQASRLLLEAQSGQLLLRSPEGEDWTHVALVTPEQALDRLQKGLLKAIEDAAPKLESLAVEREAIFARRLELSLEYRPAQKKLRPKLALCVDSQKGTGWFAFQLQGPGQVIQDELTTKDQMVTLTDPVQARAWIKRGWSILVLSVREGLDLHVQYREAVTKHFEDYLTQEEVKLDVK